MELKWSRWTALPNWGRAVAQAVSFFSLILVCEAIGSAATPGLLCQPRVIVKMTVKKQMECRLAGETEVLGENLPQRQLRQLVAGFRPRRPRFAFGQHMGFMVVKASLGRVSPSTSVSPANHSTNFSSIIITGSWHNRPISGRSAEWTQLDSTPTIPT
jgi:hypothetical protein